MTEQYADSDLIDLLGQYGDAIEQHVTAEAERGSDNAATMQAEQPIPAPLGDGAEMSFDFGEVSASPVVEEKRSPRLLVGAAIAAIVIVLAGVFAVNSGSSEVGTIPVADEEVESVELLTAPGTASAEATIAFSGRGNVLFVDGEFVTIGSDDSFGISVSRSPDGLEWTSEATVGIPENVGVLNLVQTESGWAALVESFPEFGAGAPGEEDDFEEFPASSQFLVTSPDLVNWEFAELPVPSDVGQGIGFGGGLASSGDQLAALYVVADPVSQLPTSFVRVGPSDGPFDIVELPGDGFAESIVGTDQGFALITTSLADLSATVLTSTNGFEWVEQDTSGVDLSTAQLVESDGLLLAVGQNLSNNGSVAVSSDFGVTWTENAIPAQLDSFFSSIAAGPAGFAVQIGGFAEVLESPFGDEVIEVPKDGFTMTIEFLSSNSTLTGPDGTVIHDSINLDQAAEAGIENVIRFDGPDGESLTWLDPETGEDLVTFTDADFDPLFAEFEAQLEQGGPEDPQATQELWVSADAQTWTLLQREVDSGGETVNIAAVGDDEVLVHREPIVVFSEELAAIEAEGREPTAEELAEIGGGVTNPNDIPNSTFESIPIG